MKNLTKTIKQDQVQKKCLVYRNNAKLDSVIAAMLFFMGFEVILFNDHEISKNFIAASGLFCFFTFFVVASLAECRRKYLTRNFDGRFDELLRKMYIAGLEIENKFGKKYVFVTRYILLPKTRLVVEDFEKYCEIFGTKLELDHLSKSGIVLSEKSNLE